MARELSAAEKTIRKNRDMLMEKSGATIKINNVEVLVSEYMKDPDKYNKAPLDEKFLKEVEDHFEKSMEVNSRLQFDRGSIKTLL